MPTLRLAALGDSLMQGFQSAAIEQSKLGWSTPAIVARALGLDVPTQFRVPRIPGPGLPLNLEDLLRSAERALGKQVSNAEWVGRFPAFLNRYLDGVEDYYERGGGTLPAKFRGIYQNLSVWGYTVHESTSLTLGRCRAMIESDEGFIEDDFFGIPSAPMYRTALRVLNPSGLSADEETQVSTLSRLVQADGVDVLMLGLGANDCLGTVLSLDVRDMADARGPIPGDTVARDRAWNLTSAAQFAIDYASLAQQVSSALAAGTHVLVSNIPHVTIPPITTGVGAFDGTYYDGYARFFVNNQNRPWFHKHLTRTDAQKIDARIDAFNRIIASEAGARGWHVVDVCGLLDALAVKRQGAQSDPEGPLRAYLPADHPLLALEPLPSILQLRLDAQGKRVQGGLFSLDGVHPSTLGYGLIAELYLNVLRRVLPEAANAAVPWREVMASDSLLNAPPALWEQTISTAESLPALWDLVFRAFA